MTGILWQIPPLKIIAYAEMISYRLMKDFCYVLTEYKNVIWLISVFVLNIFFSVA